MKLVAEGGLSGRPTDSQVDYSMNMANAQSALQISITNTNDETTALQNMALIQAIGTGIGNSAAHEIAHQFLGSCCDMDSNPLGPGTFNPDPSLADPGARGTYHATGCSG